MAKTIWKFPLAVTDRYQVTMPKGAEILTAQQQNEQACIWAIVDPQATSELRVFEIHGTGNPMYEDIGIQRKYIGTFQQPPFVWHVFELL